MDVTQSDSSTQTREDSDDSESENSQNVAVDIPAVSIAEEQLVRRSSRIRRPQVNFDYARLGEPNLEAAQYQGNLKLTDGFFL